MAPSTLTALEHSQRVHLTDNSYSSSHMPTIQITSLPYPLHPRPMNTSSQPTKKSSIPSPTRGTSQHSASRTIKPAPQSAHSYNNKIAAYNLWNLITIESTPPNAPSKHSRITSSADYAARTKIFPSNCGTTWPPKQSSRATSFGSPD